MKCFDRIVIFCLFFTQNSIGQTTSLNSLFELNSGHHTNFIYEKFQPLCWDWSKLDTVVVPSFNITYGIGTGNYQNIDGLYQQRYKALKCGLKYSRRSLTYPLGSSLLLSNSFRGKFKIKHDRFLVNSDIQYYNHSRKEFGYLIDPDTIFPTQSMEIEFFESLLSSSSSYRENSYIELSPGFSLNSNQRLFLKGSYSQRKREFISNSSEDIFNFDIFNDSSYTHDSFKNLAYECGIRWTYEKDDKKIVLGADRVLMEYRNSGNNKNLNGYQVDISISNRKNNALFKYNNLGVLRGKLERNDSINDRYQLCSQITYSEKKLAPWLLNYNSNHLVWDNNSSNFRQRKTSVSTNLKGKRLPKISGSFDYYFENVYIDNVRNLLATSGDWLLSFSISDTVKIKRWKLIGENVLSFINENSRIRFPLFKSNSWISYNFRIFKQKLELEPALGINYFSEYSATWNDPITGYKILTDELIGGYPFLNARLQAKIDQVYFGLKMTHVNEYTMGAHYIDFRTPGLNRLMIGFIRWKLAY
jgi:hypothetical protein